ncbi:ATP-binding protein [Streptomyces pinistramenti]|uniref:ATP-binding protein n=1 Tax=Streptomyces pinistramenti TaxID=2884812 RepID=UPI001D089224|nr:ATP-binding protein [Streptomyces pinistramenti]MCB5910396.1 ATP-binding protein [Streptomyces pinistramenti]
MRIPVRHVAKNVIWTRQGTCWALWRVEGSGHAQSSRTVKERRLRALEALVKQLHGESMLMSLCPQIDPADVVRKMTDGVDLAASERYAQLATRVWDQLECMELTGRADFLAVPLPAGGRTQAAGMAFDAARAEMALQLGLLPAPVSAREEQRRQAQARDLAAAWPSSVALRAATEAEILWIYGHSARRGVLEPLLPEPDRGTGRGRGRGAAALGQAVVAEGAAPDGEAEEGEGAAVRGRFGRRWLQVATPWGESYQTFLSLAEMPDRFAFPGSEYLAALDEFAFPVDWVMRLNVTTGAVAARKARRQARELAGQPQEYEGEPAGAPEKVFEAAEGIEDFSSAVTRTRSEVEVRAMGTLCVWGATPAEAEARAADLTTHFGGNDYTFTRPLGEQESLFYGMLPGARTPKVMASYAQVLLARDFAMAGAFSGSALGDAKGPLYGLQLSGGGTRPVLTDWSLGPRKSASASAAFIGELGGGKSVAMKSAVYGILAAGRKAGVPGSRGRAVIVDRTPQQEWLRFAQACPGTTQVITLDDQAQVSLDPLRTIRDPAQAQRRTESFLTLLLGIAPMSEQGVTLSEAIEATLAGAQPSLAGLVEGLRARGKSDVTAYALARQLSAVARKDLARALFDPALPVVDTTQADAVVFAVANLALPKEHELAADRLAKLEFEKTFGRAALYLIAALCREICFALPHEFCVAVWDECWWLTSSPEGMALLLELVRDGRKHAAGVLAGSHDGEDIGPEASATGKVVRGLFPRKFLFRQTDVALARRGLEFLDLDPADAELVELVTAGLSPMDVCDEVRAQRAGECLHRDLYGRVGGMQVVIPADERAAAAIHSDPALAV